ncbi:hypothetical protein C5C71_01890 [Rathayibacter sp. AY1C1]|uniref:hypothetical protein n=1 Tax=Rathayibacter sp. AY1C1 TaxID=2080534 RepID=UPI000CE8360A|nr:hypothetical protein [Rathayibacter sp. AY1C1]PPH13325.1 hypothetical protein C5C71_01890 [Rathayibacter sp. AY1C1]
MWFETVVLLVVGAILGVLFQWLFDRWRHVADDYELWVDYDYRSIASERALSPGLPKLEYAVQGVPVPDPGILDVYVWSAGKKDIQYSQFDQVLDLTVDFNVEVFDELKGGHEHNAANLVMSMSADGHFSLSPGLVRKDMARHYRLLVSGEPSMKISSQISDVVVRSYYREWHRPWIRNRIKRWAGGIISFVVGPIAFNVLGIKFWPFQKWLVANDLDPLIGLLISFAIMAVGVTLFTTSFTPPRKPSRAARILNRNIKEHVLPRMNE